MVTPITRTEFDALEGMAKTLTASGLYRVLRRFTPRDRYSEPDGEPQMRGLYVDVETTGKNHATDAIIEFCGLPFTYGARNGRVYDVGEPIAYFEDPDRPIPETVVDLTGITNEMVRGHRIDDSAVNAALESVNLVIAHNAGFDRPFLEHRLDGFSRKPWACSMGEVPWDRSGCRSKALDYILLHHCAEFFDGHRAEADCRVGVHLLATPMVCGTIPLACLLESARKGVTRLWAHSSPIALKDMLKDRGYRWHAGTRARPKSWYVDVAPDNVDAECAWLTEHIFAGQPRDFPRNSLSARTRYSTRE